MGRNMQAAMMAFSIVLMTGGFAAITTHLLTPNQVDGLMILIVMAGICFLCFATIRDEMR